MKSIVVFCGSSSGSRSIYTKTARDLGKLLAEQQIQLVYGGAKVGLMGSIADGCLEAGGKVLGIIPSFLKRKEIVHDDLTKLVTVETMHQRKRMMSDESDGCIALPGGYGTLEELFELLTDAQLGMYNYPIGLLNVDGYYDHLISLLDQMATNGLLKQENRDMLLVSDTPEDLLELMANYTSKVIPKWIS